MNAYCKVHSMCKVHQNNVIMLQSYKDAKLQSCKVAKLQSCKVAKLQCCNVAKLQSYRCKVQGCKGAKLTAKKIRGQANKQANGVTSSLLELLVAAKNDQYKLSTTGSP